MFATTRTAGVRRDILHQPKFECKANDLEMNELKKYTKVFAFN